MKEIADSIAQLLQGRLESGYTVEIQDNEYYYGYYTILIVYKRPAIYHVRLHLLADQLVVDFSLRGIFQRTPLGLAHPDIIDKIIELINSADRQ